MDRSTAKPICNVVEGRRSAAATLHDVQLPWFKAAQQSGFNVPRSFQERISLWRPLQQAMKGASRAKSPAIPPLNQWLLRPISKLDGDDTQTEFDVGRRSTDHTSNGSFSRGAVDKRGLTERLAKGVIQTSHPPAVAAPTAARFCNGEKEPELLDGG